MKITQRILLIIVISSFLIILQKWRRIMKESISGIDDAKAKQRKTRAIFLIDVFSLGFLALDILLLYFTIADSE